MSSPYEKYAFLMSQIKDLETQKAACVSEILQDMRTQNVASMSHAMGKFTVSKLKRWTYPESVEKLQDKYKAAKAKAESTGEATYEETESLRFTPIKL